MLDTMRLPFFILAIILIALVVLVEVAMPLMLGSGLPNRNPDLSSLDSAGGKKAPGMAIYYMALMDGLVLYTVFLMGAPLIVPERIHARFQGVATLIVSLLLLLAEIAMILMAIVFLLVMVSLLLAPIFGTIAYFVLFSDFDTSGARTILSLIMTLKIGFAICLGLAHQRFIQNKGLVLIVLTSLVCNIVITFLHGFVPGFLVSITDALAAIIVGIIAAVWSVVFLIGSIPSIVKVLRVDRAFAS